MMTRKWKINPIDEEMITEQKEVLQNVLFEKFKIQEDSIKTMDQERYFLKGVDATIKTNSSCLKEFSTSLDKKLQEVLEKLETTSKNVHKEGVEIARRFWIYFFPRLDELFSKYRIEDLIKEAAASAKESKLNVFVAKERAEIVKSWLEECGVIDRVNLKVDESFAINDIRVDWDNGGIDYVSAKLFDKIMKELEEEVVNV
jgi:hypothetical protein